MSAYALVQALEQIRAIIDEVLPRKTRPVRSGKTKERVSDTKSSALPGHILGLKNSGFFKQPKTAIEVHGKLQSSYPCDSNRVAFALLRSHKKRTLRKTSKTVGKRKQIAYAS